MRAEKAVAYLGSTSRSEELPGGASPATMAKARQRLDNLGQQWRDLADGTAITLAFGHDPEPPGLASRDR